MQKDYIYQLLTYKTGLKPKLIICCFKAQKDWSWCQPSGSHVCGRHSYQTSSLQSGSESAEKHRNQDWSLLSLVTVWWADMRTWVGHTPHLSHPAKVKHWDQACSMPSGVRLLWENRRQIGSHCWSQRLVSFSRELVPCYSPGNQQRCPSDPPTGPGFIEAGLQAPRQPSRHFLAQRWET